MKAVCVPHFFEQDPSHAPPVPWNEQLYNPPTGTLLTVGYFETDDWFEPCPASKRALRETLDHLQHTGHKCVPFQPPTNGWANFGLLVQLNASEGIGRVFREALDGEAPLDEYQMMLWGDMIPKWLSMQWIVRLVLGDRMAHLFQASSKHLSVLTNVPLPIFLCLTFLVCSADRPPSFLTTKGSLSTVYQVWQATAELLEMRSKWSDAVRDVGVHVILHPAMPIPAPFCGTATQNPNVSYMQIAPLLGWPSGVVPVTTIQSDEQQYHDVSSLPANQQDRIAQAAATVMKDSAGLPMSVSVLAPAFRDETCLFAMKEIECLAKFHAKPEAYYL
jgi:Asp-tRNA(Asn)/Glu-tRNA(Gln) amidotransferase A subunit family amidase